MPHHNHPHLSSTQHSHFSPYSKSNQLPTFIHHHHNPNPTHNHHQQSPSLLIKNRFAHFNHQLLLPRCLQKSLNRPSPLSPLSTNLKTQSVFKLKNYFQPQQRPFDQPPLQYDQHPPLNQTSKDDSYVRLSFLRQNSSLHQDNKENTNDHLSYHNQLARIMLNKSKLKYTPRATFRKSKTKCTDESKNSIEKSVQKFQISMMSKTSSKMKMTKCSLRERKSHQVKQLKPLLNSTRSRIFCEVERVAIGKIKISKKDIFPLQRLIEKRSQKTYFRNKWFTSKTVQNQRVDE